MILIDKSNQNFEIALCAEEKGYYDVAVSRLYYSIYQKVLYYLDKNGMKIEDNEKKEKGSHSAVLGLMSQHVRLFHREGTEIIGKLQDIKFWRTKADYENKKIDKVRYTIIKKDYEKINNFLNNLLSKST